MLRTDSVSSSLLKARNSTLFYYRPPSNFPSVKDIFGDESISDINMHPICRSVCQVSSLFLCRILEVLSLRISDIFEPDRVVCRGSKRGAAYLIYLPGLCKQVSSCLITDASLPLFPVSYSQCYRSFIRAGIRLDRPGYKNVMRCHSGRYLISNLFKAGSEDGVLSDLLHHKSKSSLSFYL